MNAYNWQSLIHSLYPGSKATWESMHCKAENSPNIGKIFKDGPKRKWLQEGGAGGNSVHNMILKPQKIKQNTEWNKGGKGIAQTGSHYYK